MKTLPNRLLKTAALAVFLLAAACSKAPAAAPAPAEVFAADPVLRDFYKALGGEALLGAITSPLSKVDGMDCQYTLNVLMCSNPTAAEPDRLSLYPLGRSLDEHDAAFELTSATPYRSLGGYLLLDDFAPLYDRIGAGFAGAPLTQVRINYPRQRVEQYFENVGFYRRLSDPPEQAHLLAYGAFGCGSRCSLPAAPEASVRAGLPGVHQPFALPILKGSAIQALGLPLTQPFGGNDGSVEQIFENGALFAPTGSPLQAQLRPLPGMLGQPAHNPVQPNPDGRMTFYSQDGNSGYNVPLVFDRYLQQNGGAALAGNPVADPTYTARPGIFRQCFERLCLDYDQSAPAVRRVRPARLGAAYLAVLNLDPAVILPQTAAPALPTAAPATAEPEASPLPAATPTLPAAAQPGETGLTLSISKEKSSVRNGENQTLTLRLVRQDDASPAAGVSASLVVTLPDGREEKVAFPPSGADGTTRVEVPTPAGISNGSILAARACTNPAGGQSVCAGLTYLVWNP